MSGTVCFLKTKLLLLESTIIFPYPSLPITLMTFMGPCFLRFIPKWRRCSSRYCTAQHPEPLWRTLAVHQWIREGWINPLFHVVSVPHHTMPPFTLSNELLFERNMIYKTFIADHASHSILKKIVCWCRCSFYRNLDPKLKLPQKLEASSLLLMVQTPANHPSFFKPANDWDFKYQH